MFGPDYENHSNYSNYSNLVTENELESVNDWDIDNINAILKWKDSCEELSFVFDVVRQKYKKRVERISLLQFVFDLIISSLLLLSVSLDENEYPKFYLIQQILAFTLSLVTSFTGGILKIFKWNDTVESYKEYSVKVDNFKANLISETTLPVKLRKNGIDFIVQNKTVYYDIVHSAPQINVEDYSSALIEYNDFIKNKKQKKGRIKKIE
jgi:hypothetical protein